jgi:DNA-binding PadR family transcriptional regulator
MWQSTPSSAMAIHHALLSLLADGESYGYELKGAFERSVGPQWGALNIGHLYQVLDRLKRDGHVAVVRAEPQPRRPDRLIYAITDTGRAELRRWLLTPSPPAAGYRDDLYLKLVAGARTGDDELAGVIRREREGRLAELHALRELAARKNDPLTTLLTEGAALQVEARLRLLELAEHDMAALVAAAHPRAAPRGDRDARVSAAARSSAAP